MRAVTIYPLSMNTPPHSPLSTFRYFLRTEFAHWQWYECVWLCAAVAMVAIGGVCAGDSAVGLCSALSGSICVVLTGKGKLSAYLFGIVNCVLYAWISYTQTLYGETMLNILYYLPLQFIGFYLWRNNMNNNTAEVQRLRMTTRGRLLWCILLLLFTWAYSAILAHMGDALPWADSFTTVASVIAMTLSVKRYSEQWFLWIAINTLSIWMWWNRYTLNGENMATLLMWGTFFLNSFYGLIKWNKINN